jgi:cellulose synthase/poly-beta-1,6-N-acetylglucosamine synthase-like glycosyltransferase
MIGSWQSLLLVLLLTLEKGLIAYVIAIDLVQLVLLFLGFALLRRQDHLSDADREVLRRSPLAPPISILAPAHNEGATVAASTRAMLTLNYPSYEVVIINDGSKDETLQVLVDEFHLYRSRRVPTGRLATKPVRAVYESRDPVPLVVIDKENGGKADALNAGLRFARTPLFCAIDADTMLDQDALSRIVWEFETHPDTVAAGGIVRVINGSRVEGGRVTKVSMPRSWLPSLQVLEYLRAFLGGRIAWSRLRMLLIISGAFGLFRREVVTEAGGYDTETVGEDAELILRLHRHQRDREKPCRIVFFPDPICWTEAPFSLRVLMRQRDRWQRGLLQMLWKHRRMAGRRRYGTVGAVALPYFAVFEAAGPLIEVAGYLAFAVALAIGAVSWGFTLIFLTLAVGFGIVMSLMTLLMEERAFRRYPSWSSLGRLLATSVLENAGYRQLLAVVRARSWWTQLRGQHGWGEMVRQGHDHRPAQLPAQISVEGVPGVDGQGARLSGGELQPQAGRREAGRSILT